MGTRPVLGINLASSIAFTGVADSEGCWAGDPLERLTLASSLEGAEQLADFSSQVEQELRRLAPAQVGILQPNKHRDWVYAQAFARVSLEVSIMIAASRVGVQVRQITPIEIAKAVGASSKLTTLTDLAESILGVSPTRYWRQGRALAFLTAHVMADSGASA